MTDFHAGSGEADLETALSNLKKGDRVYITFDDYAKHYSPDGEYPHEFDEAGKLALANLAASYRCMPKKVDAERRIYFSKT